MRIQKRRIIEKAGEIVMRLGVESLSLNTIAQELDMSKEQLSVFASKENDLFLLLFNDFENDILDLLEGFAQTKHSPQKDLQKFFTKLHSFFYQKPYYLELIFDKNIMKRDAAIIESFLRIKRVTAAYLGRLINEGKQSEVFITKQSTQSLVNGILSSFRFLMKDEQLMNEMIRKFGALQLQK